MPGIDSLLRMLVDNAADELRLASDEAPRMLRRGAPVRLSIPPTPDDILRHLLGELLTDAHDQTLAGGGKVELRHALGRDAFAGTIVKKGGGMEIVFKRGAAPSGAIAGPAPVPVPIQAAPVAAVRAPTPIATPIAAPPPAPLAAQNAPQAQNLPPARNAPRVQNVPVAQNASDQPIQAVLTLSHELQQLLERAVTMGASDVHLGPQEPPTLRIDGQLRALDAPAVDAAAWLAGVVDAAAVTRALEGRSIDLAFAVPGLGRFRLNLYRVANQLAAAIRVLPARVPTLAQLHLPPMLEEIVAAPHGLVLVTGPTGSGKSATLAALAQAALRRRPGLIITLEDPVEYALEPGPGTLVRQRQIGHDAVDFATGLRDALREDPDVLLIGEMRDAESIGLAITAAETGHLVLASLHSRSAPSSIQRIVDSYAPERQPQIRSQLADALRAVIAQRLVPNARGDGRVPAVEVLRLSTAAASLLREGKTEQLVSVMQGGRKEGMVVLERSLADLVKANHITRDAAAAVANDINALTSYLQG